MREAPVLLSCKKLLTLLKNQGKLTFRRIHVNAIPRGSGRLGYKLLSKNTDMAGMPDFEVYLPGGRILHVECKSSIGRQSEEQVEWEKELNRYNHPYLIVRELDQLVDALSALGISNWAFPVRRLQK